MRCIERILNIPVSEHVSISLRQRKSIDFQALGKLLMGWVRGWRASHAVQLWLLAAGWCLLAAGCWLLAPGGLATQGRATTASQWKFLRLSISASNILDFWGCWEGEMWRKL